MQGEICKSMKFAECAHFGYSKSSCTQLIHLFFLCILILLQTGGDPFVLCFVDFKTPGQAAVALEALQGKTIHSAY